MDVFAYWNRYVYCMVWKFVIRKSGMEVCAYWNRDMGLELFGCHIIAPPRVQNRVVKGVLSLVMKERWVSFHTHRNCF